MVFSIKETKINEIHNVLEGKMQPGAVFVQNRYADGIVYIYQGTTKYEFVDQTFSVQSGNILFLAKNSSYKMTIPENYHFIYFDIGFDKSPLKSSVYKNIPSELIESLMKKMQRQWILGKISSKFKYLAFAYEILSYIIDDQTKDYIPASKRKLIEKAAALMLENFSDYELSINEISKELDISPVHFRRLFSSAYGISPIKFLTNIRMKQAKSLLLNHSISISDIASSCGYSNVYYFSRFFKKEVGYTPSDYRKKGF